METWRHGDIETWRHTHGDMDMETWRHGDMETSVYFYDSFTIFTSLKMGHSRWHKASVSWLLRSNFHRFYVQKNILVCHRISDWLAHYVKRFHLKNIPQKRLLKKKISPQMELTYPNPSLHLINFFGREGNINLT